MSFPQRSGVAQNRNTSFVPFNRDAPPPVVAHKRGPPLGQRPPLAASSTPLPTATTRSASNAKAKKNSNGIKARAAPVSAAAKRIAAKGTTLRTRMPYLRPNASLLPHTPTTSGDASMQLPSCPPLRSFSSSASTYGSAPWLKASYAAIPDALQQVKKVCNAAKELGDKEASVVLGGSNARERHLSRPTSMTGGKSSSLSEEASTVILNIEVIQGMLFSSLQTPTVVEATTPAPPPRDATAGSHVQRSKSCNAQLESPFISPATGLFLSRKDRHKSWALLLHKQTHTFPILVNAARSPLAAREARVAATILTFLYNVLRHMVGERQRKAVLLCEKLGLIRVCTLVLQENRHRLRAEVVTSAARASYLRACEAAGLLFTLAHTFNVKLSAAFRLSQSLDCTLACAFAAFSVLEVEFAAFQQSVHTAGSGKSLREMIKAHAEANSRKDTLKLWRSFQSRSQWSVITFSHLCFILFVFTGNAASAKELGGRGSELCATAIAMTTYFLSQVVPVLLANVLYDRQEDTLHPIVGQLVAVDQTHWAPVWVVKMLRHVELMLLWCVALLHRLGSCDKVQEEVAAVALRSHVPRGCQVFLAPSSRESVQLAPRRECVHVILLLLSVLLQADRAGVLADMKDLGGLKSLVTGILALNETAAQQWHHYYVQLATMYGCLHLPALAGRSPCYIDQRIPTSLRRFNPTSQETTAAVPKDTKNGSNITSTSLHESTTAVVTPLSDGADELCKSDGRVSAHASSTELQRLNPVEKFAPLPEAVINPLPPSSAATQGGDLTEGLLLVDTRPNLFSPELHQGVVDPASELPEFVEGQLPWPFTEAAPPTTAEHWQGQPSHIKSLSDDDHLQIPLKVVSQEDRVRVLRHHITRLTRLNEAACDATDNPHVYKVVFERKSCGSSTVRDAAVQRSHDGISFFSDFECGNLQRAVEVADNEFDLVLAWDTATNSYTQWFNFGIRNFKPGKTYHFNILNMEKLGSTFNDGQKPLLLHVPESSPYKSGKKTRAARHWRRVGQNIFYFRNTYERPARAHFFSTDTEIAGAFPITATKPGGNLATSHASPTTGTSQRFSPARPNAGGGAVPRLSTSRTPPAPPPLVVKMRTPTTVTPAPFGTNTASTNGSADDGDEGGKKQKNYFTVTFSVTMPTEGSGRVYLANCFPFSYSELRQHVSWLVAQTHCNLTETLRAQALCVTPGGLPVPLLTATALHRRDSGEPYTAEEIKRRPMVLLVARVHPGETNASWVMQGLLDALLSPTAATAAWSALLCENFVFKIVPMLNVDGVMMGNHRCSFAGMDMNRDYLEPKAELNPTLYALKQLLRYWRQEEGRQTVLFADFHGHSRAKNFLVYGCTSETMRSVAQYLGGKDKSVKSRNAGGNGDGDGRRVRVRQMSTDAPLGPEKFIAVLLNYLFPSFSLSQSSYAVTKDKVNSARVVLYDEFGVRMSYGFESTMVGGRISVPDLLLPLTDAAGTTGALWKEEVHYSPIVFRAMGDAFIRAFAMLAKQWLAVTKTVSISYDNGNGERMPKCEAETPCGCSADVLQALWAATAAAGGARDAPKGRPEELAKSVSSSEPRVGLYATATRSDRRQGNTASSSSINTAANSTTVHDVAVHIPAVSAAGQLDALNYLFLASRREVVLQEGDDTADDDADQRTVDGSEAMSVVDESDTERSTKLEKMERGKKEGDGDGSEVEDRNPLSAPSDSGSDDHDWSGFNSSASSTGDDIDVERSSASSVDDEIPANLFM